MFKPQMKNLQYIELTQENLKNCKKTNRVLYQNKC